MQTFMIRMVINFTIASLIAHYALGVPWLIGGAAILVFMEIVAPLTMFLFNMPGWLIAKAFEEPGRQRAPIYTDPAAQARWKEVDEFFAD